MAIFGLRSTTARRRLGRASELALLSAPRAVAVGFEPTVAVNHTRFRGVLLWPLGHATAEEITGRSEPSCLEEVDEQFGAFALAHARDDLGAVVESTVAHDVPE